MKNEISGTDISYLLHCICIIDSFPWIFVFFYENFLKRHFTPLSYPNSMINGLFSSFFKTINKTINKKKVILTLVLRFSFKYS